MAAVEVQDGARVAVGVAEAGAGAGVGAVGVVNEFIFFSTFRV